MFIKAKKNVIELNDSERNSWMKGEELIKDLGEKSRFVVLKNKNDILGCGRYKEKKLFNYVPKERRLRVIIDWFFSFDSQKFVFLLI